MTFDQLRIFIAVAEREHMTDGARAVNVTQSAASAAVAALEGRHGVTLFHRVGRSIRLTDAGRLFLVEARGVVARVAAAELVLDEIGGLRRGHLRVVSSQTIAAYWLPPVLADLRARHPQLGIDLVIRNTGQAATMVEEGEADFGIVEGAIDAPALIRWPLGEDRLVLVQAERFEGANVSAAILRAARWTMREPGSGTRSSLDADLRTIGVDPGALDVTLVLPSNESVRSAVEAGSGLTALSDFVVAASIAAGRLHALPLDLGLRQFFGLLHRERTRSKATEALIALIDARSESKAPAKV